jgi:hypothetical protein
MSPATPTTSSRERHELPPKEPHPKHFVKSVEEHWDGIISWHASRISNGLLEGTNSLIQAAKARARGYRSKRKMIAITYLIAGKLPTPSPFVTHTM